MYEVIFYDVEHGEMIFDGIDKIKYSKIGSEFHDVDMEQFPDGMQTHDGTYLMIGKDKRAIAYVPNPLYILITKL